MNNRILNVNDVENSIDIFGNEFELEFSENYINRLRSINVDKIREENVFKQLKELMNLVLNDKEAYDKIAKSYEEQKGKEFGLQAFIKVFEFIFNEYVNEMNNLNSRTNSMFNARPQMPNREQRRNNNRYNKGNRYNNYRRY